jgi:hypothetical protein
MTEGGSREKYPTHTAFTSMLPGDFNQTLRLSLTKSLAQYYAPLDDIPPEIRELLLRLDDNKI